MLVYAIHVTTRLQYILEFVCKELFHQNILITKDQNEFNEYEGPKINYSLARLSNDEFWICNTDLLFETGLETQNIHCFEIRGYKAFFKREAGDFPFDILAASFYLLSRYEEYLPHAKDKYGRYAHLNCLAHKEGFLHLPLINIWLLDFKKSLLQKYPGLKLSDQRFTYLPTYDIDIAWSYQNKGWLRNTGGLLRSIIQKDGFALRDRVQVLLKRKKDPFDPYDWLDTIHKYVQAEPIYFFLLAFERNKFDKNISPFDKELQALIKYHDSIYLTGIHPSYYSQGSFQLLQQEKRQLEHIVSHRIIHSRQHYLRFSIPLTYQRLISAGIRRDYSMGYGTVNGFRASVASPFYWFDLEMEVSTSLLIHPFCFMDANAYYQLKLSPGQALEQLVRFYNIIKEVNGLMITIWHNNFLGTDPVFAGWREVYEIFLKETVAMGENPEGVI
ncbi:MAG: polysaccharide deacetylase family protein [Chitinophagaceae bacterium]